MTTTVFSDIDWNTPGKQVGTLSLPHSPDDDAWGVIPFAAASIKNGDGPVVLVSGAVHGDEYEGPMVIGELLRQTRVQDVRGQLILLPGFNGPAMRAGRRTSPIDRLNLNRVFPGDPKGTASDRLAHWLVSQAMAGMDGLDDLGRRLLQTHQQQQQSGAFRSAEGNEFIGASRTRLQRHFVMLRAPDRELPVDLDLALHDAIDSTIKRGL